MLPRVVAGLFAVAIVGTGAGRAEDIKGKWYIGGNLGVLVTTDNIRSNAALIIAPLGPDGAPFTGDKGEVVSCNTGRQDVFCDPRPDELLARQTELQQTLKMDSVVGYGLTSALAVQLDAGYYKGNITNFDVFARKSVPISHNPLDPCIQLGQKQPCFLDSVALVDVRQPINAGTVTEIPLNLSAIVRFRKDSNFNPYLGAGFGYMFTSLSESPAVTALNKRLAGLRLIDITDEFGPDFGRLLTRDPNNGLPVIDNEGHARFTYPVSVSIKDGFQYQAMGGAEYFFNDRLSFSFDARYVLANRSISILMRGEDQIDLQLYTEDLFRNDGTLRVFKNGQNAPNPFDPNATPVPRRFTCDTDGDGFPNQPPLDYNKDGQKDACFAPSPTFHGDPRLLELKEQIVVQGGNIRLSNFNFGFGIRFHF